MMDCLLLSDSHILEAHFFLFCENSTDRLTIMELQINIYSNIRPIFKYLNRFNSFEDRFNKLPIFEPIHLFEDIFNWIAPIFKYWRYVQLIYLKIRSIELYLSSNELNISSIIIWIYVNLHNWRNIFIWR